jgi:hypothetical protein
LLWTYTGGSTPFGANAPWLDQVDFAPGGTGPIITIVPANHSVIMKATAAFSVGAAGTPRLFYQWQFNQTSLTNQTNAILSLLNTHAANWHQNAMRR